MKQVWHVCLQKKDPQILFLWVCAACVFLVHSVKISCEFPQGLCYSLFEVKVRAAVHQVAQARSSELLWPAAVKETREEPRARARRPRTSRTKHHQRAARTEISGHSAVSKQVLSR